MEFLIFLVAIVLFIPLTVLNLVAVGIKYSFKWSVLKKYFIETAIDIDKFGNKNLRTLLNSTLIIKKGYHFGNGKETISSVLGKNKRDSTLTKTGKAVCAILDFLDKNHCIKSIQKIWKTSQLLVQSVQL